MLQRASCNVATANGTCLRVDETATERLWREFGAWMRSRREGLRMSQEVAAGKAGMARQQWYRIEKGESGTKRSTIERIARALQVNTNEALQRAGFSSGDRPDDTELTIDMILHSGYEELSPEAKARHLAQIKRISEALLARDD